MVKEGIAIAMEDDFGELYADIDVQLSCSPTIQPQQDDENETEGHLIDSKAQVKSEAPISESGASDSEDDLRIVLNDEDDEDSTAPRALAAAAPGADNDNHNGHNDNDAIQINTTPAEQTEKRNNIKTNYYSQHSHSHYKYVRPLGAAFSAKQSGYTSATYFPSSSVNCDQDANGCYHLPVSTSSGTLCLSIGQTGCDFSLPWHKTITDISIDSFQQKPWNHHGVDTTDYFNFGLDEESWKQYCNSLKQLRQQTNSMSKTNKTYQAVGGETAQTEKGASAHEYTIKGEGGLDIPKGRAIQVDSGTGERRPSVDVWRPRNRDSDVVIQISLQNNTECSSSSTKEDLSHSENVSESGGSGRDLMQSAYSNRQFCEIYDRDGVTSHLKRCSERDVLSVALDIYPDNKGSVEIPDTTEKCISERSVEVVKDLKEQIKYNPSVEDSFGLEPEPLLGDQFWCSSSSSFSESHDGSGSSEENIHKPARRQLPNSDGELCAPLTLEYCESKEYESNADKAEQGGTKDDSRNENHLNGGQDSCSRIRLRSVVEKCNVGDSVATLMFDGDDELGDKPLLKNSCKRRKMQYKYNYCDKRYLPDYRETEIAFNYNCKTIAGKSLGDASTVRIHAEGRKKSRTAMNTSLKGYLDDKEYFVEKAFTLRENKVRQGNHRLPQRNNTNRRPNDAFHGDPACFTPECFPICSGTERYRWQRGKDEEKSYRRVTGDDDTVLEHRYSEQYVDESCVRSVPYYGREREYLNKNYDRHVSYKNPYTRHRYGGSPCLDVLSDSPCTLHCWRRPTDSSLSSHRAYDIGSKRGWHDGASLSPAMYDLRRSDGVDMGHRRQKRFKKFHNTRWFASAHLNKPDSVSVICPDPYLSNYERGNIRECEPLDWPEDGILLKIKDHDGTYADEASFSDEHHSVRGDFRIKKYASPHCRLVFDKSRLVSDRNTKVSRKMYNTGGTLVNGWKQTSKSPVFREHKPLESSKKLYSRKVNPSEKSEVEKETDFKVNTCNRFEVEKASDYDFVPPFMNNYSEKKKTILQETTGQSTKSQNYSSHGKEVLLDPAKENKMVDAFDNDRIRETLAKMVKRRERFKEPLVDKELDTTKKSVATVTVEPPEWKQQRPTRRRRWGGS